MSDFSTVYHVGFLNVGNIGERPTKVFSLEGSGISVSHFPEEWTHIARLGGSNTYKLTKDDPSFFLALEMEEQAIQWALDNDYIVYKKKFKAMMSDEEGEEFYMEMDKYQDALAESEDVQEFMGYSFGPKGKSYWNQHFDCKVENSMAVNFACIFYAETHGFDGVWWNEILDPAALSAPRGVIFQHKINEWKIIEL